MPSPTAPFAPPSRRIARWALPAGLAMTLLGCGLLGANWLRQVVHAAPDAHTGPAPLAALQGLLPGHELAVPQEAGLWAARMDGIDLLLLRALPDGEAQVLNLCQQRMGQKHDPALIYPMALRAGLAAAADTTTARNPLVLAADKAAGLPRVALRGRAAPGATSLELEVAAASPGADWAVAFAKPAAPPSPAQASGTARFALRGELWLLWHPLEPAAPTALDGKARPFRHGVRVRQVPLPNCDAGGVQWQAFDAHADARQALLWARAAHDPGPPQPVQALAGRHTVPNTPPPLVEDERLFKALMAQGLLKPLNDGRLALAPADALRASPTASAASATATAGPALRALYGSANGSYVQAQVRAANQARHWLALRHALPAAPAGAGPALRATSQGELLPLGQGLPPVSARLFSRPSPGWSDWTRVQAPQAWLTPAPDDPATSPEPMAWVEWPLAPNAGPVRLQVLGEVMDWTGGYLIEQRAACDGPGCANGHDVAELLFEPLPEARVLRLQIAPQPHFNRLLPARTEQLRVQKSGARWAWLRPSPGQDADRAQHPADVTLLARNGDRLFAQGQPTPQALAMGVGPLVGLTPAHLRSVAGMLGRLGQHGQAQANARLTLEPGHQRLLQQVLHCIGGEGGQWEAGTESCLPRPGAPLRELRSITAATVLDADTGHLLVAATGEPLPAGVQPAELLAFDRFNPQGSALALHALQHQGGAAHAPGSTFKLADALSFELAAQRSPALQAWLAGPPVAGVDAQAGAAGKPFSMGAACYPAPCAARTAKISNFGLHAPEPATRHASDGRFGLREALRHSVNTWFAMTAEWQDQTVALGHADARPLGKAALRESRPLLDTLDRLRLTEPQRLDGGLLPADFNWQPTDALLASASVLGPAPDVHAIRQQALGLRMQTTPLQMARMAAAIATGQVLTPQLLLELNGQMAAPAGKAPLGIAVVRIQQAMQDTVAMGTAAAAFKSPELNAVRPLVHGKTGSAPLASRDDTVDCKRWPASQPAPTACLHNAWFVGFLKPGALPGDNRTLAFAVQMSHTRGMGGSQAAPVVAAWLQTLWARQAKVAPRQ